MQRQKILVIKLSALGDFFQALGAMQAIRAYHKDASITLLTTSPFERLARACGYFDDVHIDVRPSLFDVRALLELRQRLRMAGFSRVYDLQNNDRTQIYFWMMCPRPPEWVGAAIGASHRNASPARTAGKAFEGHRQTLARAGILHVAPDTLAWMRADVSRFNLPAQTVLLVPGSAPNRPEKRWGTDRYAVLAGLLLARGLTPVLIGGKADADITRAIAGKMPGAIDLAGRTDLFDLAALARNAVGAIGNDTGPMHVASLTNTPCVMIFATGRGSNPDRHGPLGARSVVLAQDALEKITPDHVLSAFEDLQNGSPP